MGTYFEVCALGPFGSTLSMGREYLLQVALSLRYLGAFHPKHAYTPLSCLE